MMWDTIGQQGQGPTVTHWMWATYHSVKKLIDTQCFQSVEKKQWSSYMAWWEVNDNIMSDTAQILQTNTRDKL